MMQELEGIAKAIEAKRKVKPWIKARLESLKTLKPDARAVGEYLLGEDDKRGRRCNATDYWKRKTRGERNLQKLKDADLRAIAESLFPQFPEVMGAAWDLHKKLPIQVGWGRKPFRAPTRSDLLRTRRRYFLECMVRYFKGLEEDLLWTVGHAAHLSYGGSAEMGVLFAAAMDQGGPQGKAIQEILRASADGTHETGVFGRHVITAFLCSENPENWAYIEKMLLAAQRQEGLRQSILEAVDFTHPDAFRRMLRVILDNNLARFSSVVRAADVWLGMQLDSQSAGYVTETLTKLSKLLDDDAAREQALNGDDGVDTFLALWSVGFEDAPVAVEAAGRLIRHPETEVRFAGVWALKLLDIPEVYEQVLPAVDDADPRVACAAAAVANDQLRQRMRAQAEERNAREEKAGITPTGAEWMREIYLYQPPPGSGDLFERLERLHDRLPKKQTEGKPLLWPWMKVRMSKRVAADVMLAALDKRPRKLVLPYLASMSPSERGFLARLLAAEKKLDASSQAALLELVGDTSPDVRGAAVQAMQAIKIKAADLPALEPLLTRKSEDLRRGVLALILSLNDHEVLACAQRLMESKALLPRLAGLDLLQQMKKQERSVDETRAAAEAYHARGRRFAQEEQTYLNTLLQEEAVQITLDNALGLMDPAERTPPTPPRQRNAQLSSAAARELIKLMDGVAHDYRDVSIAVKKYTGDSEEQPLGSADHGLAGPLRWDSKSSKWIERPIEEWPLREVWLEAWAKRPKAARDADGLEAGRALLLCNVRDKYSVSSRSGWCGKVAETLVGKPVRVRHEHVVGAVLEWLLARESAADLAGFVVDGFETLLAAIPLDKLTEKDEWSGLTFRQLVDEFSVLHNEMWLLAKRRKEWTGEHLSRMFGLWRWIDEPLLMSKASSASSKVRQRETGALPIKAVQQIERARMAWDGLIEAYGAGLANEHDLYDDLLGPRDKDRYSQHRCFDALRTSSEALRKKELTPQLEKIVQRAIDRVLEIELARGEAETPATFAALGLSYAGGTDVLVRILQVIDRDPRLRRTANWYGSKGKSEVFSHLISVTVPGRHETPEKFATAVKAAGIREKTLLAVAFYAPQWARHIEAAVGMESLAETVWWFHAHTKDSNWRADIDIRESWNAEIRKLTPLALADLMEGAVDVDWFNRVLNAMGPKRWETLDGYAKYASGGAGHKRAQLFAAAMRKKVAKTALVKDIKTKRKQDAVRALGLLPLSPKTAKKDLLERYQLMQEFVRTSRQFGSQRQTSEKLAARIGQENLARTAGYPDPIRLQWAMEGLASADLAKGPIVAKAGDVVVELAIDADGQPDVSVRRGDKPLKSIPPGAKKAKAVKELTERKTDLRRSASRMRQSLELAMCRGDAFARDELVELMGNVMLKPLLERLVFVGEGILGYPVGGGKALRDAAGKVEPVKKNERLRLAHPVDLMETKRWSAWQRECFAAERVQPFKQVFRELYVLTKQEKKDKTYSRRYAGHQVNPRQALALLGRRGWVTAPEMGVFLPFHAEKLVAWLEFMETFYTPAEVEGLTLEKVRFARRGADEHVPVSEVPPRLLSEVFRDLDLVVSVAHRGGVDPEASASTVEMRASLLRETVKLLALTNVKIAEPHVHICGKRAEYSVHLGSATTHKLPGGALFIVPVHSQHRGRIFLPFADDDPKTAEVMSKVLLLARDEEIRDPSILEQIRG